MIPCAVHRHSFTISMSTQPRETSGFRARTLAPAEHIRAKLIYNVAQAGIPGVREQVVVCAGLVQNDPLSQALLPGLFKSHTTQPKSLFHALSHTHPGRSLAERQRLLHIVIVGGGPTGVEVAGEISDLINEV